MISIFGVKKKVSHNTKRRKYKKRLNKEDKEKLAKSNLSKLNPMAFGIIAVKADENPANEFLSSSKEVISERPHALTEKWIASINKFVDSTIKSTLLDPPAIEEGQRVDLVDLIVGRYVSAKEDSAYPMPALICLDDRGWKFYFKSSKASSAQVGKRISLSATVSCHKDGITFLRRPSKIKTLDVSDQNTEVDND